MQVTNAPIVPPIVLFLAKHPLVDKYDLSSVEEVTCGAAPMGEGLEEALIKRMPRVKHIRQGKMNEMEHDFISDFPVGYPLISVMAFRRSYFFIIIDKTRYRF